MDTTCACVHCTCVFMQLCVCARACMRACVHACVRVCVHVRVHACVHVCVVMNAVLHMFPRPPAASESEAGQCAGTERARHRWRRSVQRVSLRTAQDWL